VLYPLSYEGLIVNHLVRYLFPLLVKSRTTTGSAFGRSWTVTGVVGCNESCRSPHLLAKALAGARKNPSQESFFDVGSPQEWPWLIGFGFDRWSGHPLRVA
jgi:hypothetical protein